MQIETFAVFTLGQAAISGFFKFWFCHRAAINLSLIHISVLAVLCQLPASGKKKITAIGCVIVAGIGVVVCSGLSEAGQLQVLRSPAGNYQVILEKDEETGQLMLNLSLIHI